MGIAVGAALSGLKLVVERGDTLEPPLDSRVVVLKVSDIFRALWSNKMRNFAPQM